MARTSEPEVMDGRDEVAAYASASSQRHLESLDNRFVEQVLSLGSRESGCLLLDLGCGPGNLAVKIALRCPRWRVVGFDRSRTMLDAAHRAARSSGVDGRVFFLQGDGGRLGFADGTFDMVMSNSVLHHLASPKRVFQEMARVAKPDGTVLVRDLRRPSWLAFPFHVSWHGRHYSGMMKKLFKDSVRAAYTPEELAGLLRASGMARARIFLQGRVHMGFTHGARSKTVQAGVQ